MRLALAILIGFSFMWAGVVHAQKRGQVKRYERYVTSASEAFAAGEFSRAEAFFAKAYALHADPRLLYNLAVSQRRQEKKAEALENFRRFLVTAAAKHPLRVRAERAARELSEEATRATEAAPPTRAPPAPPTPVAASQPIAPPEIRPQRVGGRGLMSLTAYGMAAVGVAGLVWGGLELNEASSISEELEGLPGNTAWNQGEAARYAEGEAAQTRGLVLMSLGAASIAGGAILFWLDGEREPEDTSLSLALSPGPATLALGGRF